MLLVLLGVESQRGFGRNAFTEVAGARASSIAVCDNMSIESHKRKRLGKKAPRPRKWCTIYLHELPLDIQFMVPSSANLGGEEAEALYISTCHVRYDFLLRTTSSERSWKQYVLVRYSSVNRVSFHV